MIFHKISLTLFFLISFAFSAFPAPDIAKELIVEEQKNVLKNLTTARDSLRTLYNLFDLSDRREQQKKLAWQIYETAGRAQDINAQMDMLRNLAVYNYKNDSVIDVLLDLANRIPNEEARAATKTFIFNQHVTYRTGFPQDEKKLSDLLLDNIVNSHNLQGTDVYDRIGLLYQIIQYIGTEAEGSLFAECLDKYANLVEKLPDSDFPLKNQFYTTSAIFHSRVNGDQRRAILYDQKLIEIMDMLQDMYRKQDRKYRNYDATRFNSYRRMLSNFNVLTDKEIDDIHDSIMMLAQRNFDVYETIEKYGRAQAYYYFAKRRYDEAIPYIKKQMQAPNQTVYQRIKFADMLMKAAKETGDNKSYVDAMENYIDAHKIIDSLHAVTNEREMMIRNLMANAPILHEDDEIEKATVIKEHEISLMVVSSVLAVILLIYIVLYIRLKRSRR